MLVLAGIPVNSENPVLHEPRSVYKVPVPVRLEPDLDIEIPVPVKRKGLRM